MSASIHTLTPFIFTIVTGNLTDLMAFTSTPSLKQNVQLDLAVFIKCLSHSFNMSKKNIKPVFLATVGEQV